MIEVDANNQEALAQYIDKSSYFNKSVESLKNDYEKTRPIVLNVYPLKKGN